MGRSVLDGLIQGRMDGWMAGGMDGSMCGRVDLMGSGQPDIFEWMGGWELDQPINRPSELLGLVG